LSARTVAFALALSSVVACSSKATTPRHPVGEIRARAEAKLDLVELVVHDPTRATRLREIYLQAWQLGYEFDVARARTLQEAQAVAAERTSTDAQRRELPDGALEALLVPDPELGRETFARYTALMLEARALLSDEEFRKLDAAR
jgi:hypothetical protein